MENKEITVQQKNITDSVITRIKEMEGNKEIQMPVNYSYANALKSAWLLLQEVKTKDDKPVLEACSKVSICNALLDMCIQGLSAAKRQCYFIPYGNKLQLSKSYLGQIACTKRLKGVKDIKAYCIYEGDEFEQEFDIDTATMKITKFNPKFQNRDNSKIKGAFAVVVMDNPEENYVEVMTMQEIKDAWNQGKMKGNSGAHKNFTQEMSKKTVINRACKHFICTSDDSDVLIESIVRTNEYNGNNIDNEVKKEFKEEVDEEIKNNSTQEIIDVDIDEVEKKSNEPF